jgi:hypothetical protein
MFYDKARDDHPCVTKTPVAWADTILTASDDYLYDDEPTLDESIDIHAFLNIYVIVR